MAVNLYSASPPFGLFNILGNLFDIEEDINTSRLTTIPTGVLNALTTFNSITTNSALSQAFANLPSAIPQYQGGASGCLSTIQTIAQNLLITMVNNDQVQPDNSLKTAIQYIITQMLNTAQSINKSTVTVVPTAAGGNTGNGALIGSIKRGDGLIQENMLAETLAGTFSATGLATSLSLKGQASASTPLGQDWPSGSGATSTLTSVDANSSSMIANGGMETWLNAANVPDSWIAKVATPGTTLKQTILDVQTLTITGASTSGTYQIQYTNPAGKIEITAPIAFNATGSSVQAALRLLAGLGLVTVASSGTSPDFTHIITFAGAGGLQTLVSIINNTTGLTITPTHTTSGTTQVFAGSFSCQFLSNGAELTELWAPIPISSLLPNTAYGISLWAVADAAIAAGVVTIDLFDGSAVINDAQAVANSLTFNATSLTTSFKHLSALTASECAFRTPAVLPANVYLRVRISTALTNARSMYIDQVAMTPLTQLYNGGPYMALFSGSTAWTTNDTFTVTTTNNRAGILREWLERNFSTSSLGLLFPTNASPTIPDSVVS